MNGIFWAAEPAWLEKYLSRRAEARREDITAAIELFPGIPAPGSEQAVDGIYSRQGETARIRIEGALSPNGPDALDRLFGIEGASYNTVTAAINRAKTDPLVKSVIFDIDSPGGTVAGCDETWQAHKALAAVKPTEVRAGSVLASAAYYIASPAGKILAASPTGEIGSIGVAASVYDYSGMQEQRGIKKIKIVSSNAPLKNADAKTDEGYHEIKRRLDALERIFYARVSEGRGVSTEHIAERFGKGGLLVASDPSPDHDDAIGAGMIDGLAADTVSAAGFERETAPGMNKETPPKGETADFGPISPAQAGTRQEGNMADLTAFLKENPGAAAEFDRLKSEAKAEGRAEAEAGYSARVEAALPVIMSEAYPPSIKALAKDAFKGGEGMAAFRAGVSVFDAQNEKAASDAAKAETEALGAVSALAPDNRPAAEKELDAAIQAEIEKRKVK